MSTLKKCIATKGAIRLVLLALSTSASLAYATPVGTITHLSGPLLDKKADGSVKVLSVQSAVEQGDTLVTQKDTYAQIKFTDDSLITLKPDTQFKIDSFSFEPEKKENDSALFSLIKGGLREVTGLLGKRSKERFGLHTPTATIGIRGTVFLVQVTPASTSSELLFGNNITITPSPANLDQPQGGMTSATKTAGGSAGSIADGLNPSTAGGATTGGGSTTTQPTKDPSSGTGGDNVSTKTAKVDITIQKPDGGSSSIAGGQSSAGTGAGATTVGGVATTPPTTNSSSGPPSKPAPATSATSGIPSHMVFAITPSPGAAPALTPTTPRPEAPVKPVPATPANPGTLPGVYVQVQDGMIHVSNSGGSQIFAAGQFGYVPNINTPPIILPNNPGLNFSPPPSFSSSTVGQGSKGALGKEGEVDCVVR